MREHRIKDGQLQVKSAEQNGRIHWRTAEWRECYQCGATFVFEIKWPRERNKGYFCSQKCNGLWRAKLLSAKRVGKRCPICHLWFKVQPSKAKRQISCGRPACRYAVRSQAGIRSAAKRQKKV